MITFISFILILGLLVLVHEIGHFVTARKLGVDVEEFGIGFPPRIFSFKKGDVKYSLNWIPLGGFVKIKGESGDEDKDDKHSFANQAAWKKSIILCAGVFMNFVLAIVLFTIGFSIGLPQAIDQDTNLDNIKERNVVISELIPESLAESKGIEIGDKVLYINDIEVVDSDMLSKQIKENENLSLVIQRGEEEKEVSISKEDRIDNDIIGVGMMDVGIIRYNIFESFVHGFKTTIIMIGMVFKAFYNLLYNLITTGSLTAELSGPVGVAVLTGKIVQLGFIYILQFAALLSINLGVINILPFPALDGGRLLFVLIEKIRGRALSENVEGLIHNSGFILLILLLIVVTFRDIGRYGSNILEAIKNIF